MLSYMKVLGIVRAPLVILLGSMTLGGCAASRTMIRYGSLNTRTEMSESVFLELRSDLPQTVYISESSTAGRDLTIRPALDRELSASGYTVVGRPDDATYLIQINHLRLVETDLSDDVDLGDAIVAGFAAGTVAALITEEIFNAPGVAGEIGLIVGVLGFVLDANTKNIAHTLTTDILVTESVRAGGTESELRYHETQIVTGASKVNLSWEESLPAIIGGLNSSIRGLLPTRAPYQRGQESPPAHR